MEIGSLFNRKVYFFNLKFYGKVYKIICEKYRKVHKWA